MGSEFDLLWLIIEPTNRSLQYPAFPFSYFILLIKSGGYGGYETLPPPILVSPILRIGIEHFPKCCPVTASLACGVGDHSLKSPNASHVHAVL